jgi:hypothetical protein
MTVAGIQTSNVDPFEWQSPVEVVLYYYLKLKKSHVTM